MVNISLHLDNKAITFESRTYEFPQRSLDERFQHSVTISQGGTLSTIWLDEKQISDLIHHLSCYRQEIDDFYDLLSDDGIPDHEPSVTTYSE